MGALQKKNHSLISCCESNNIFSHIEMYQSLKRVQLRFKKFNREFGSSTSNCNSTKSETISNRKKRMNVVNQPTDNTKKNKIKSEPIVICGMLLFIINLIVILYS